MRKIRPLDALFPRVRQALLAATLLHPGRWWYLSDLAKHLGIRPSSLQRELAALVDAGILNRRQDGNRVYFQANADCPFLPELQGVFVKTVGVVDVLREVLSRFAKHIDSTFVYGSMARATEITASSDVDLMIVGQVGLADLTPALRRAEARLGRPVNPTLYTREEFATKLQAGHHFLKAVLDGEKLVILGDPHDLAAAPHHPPRADTRDQPPRARRPAGRRRTGP
jgi:DNA-binding transcriptional ArsR family regulator